MTTAEYILLALVGIIAGVALYIGIKAHLHHATLSAEVANQKGKVENIGATVTAAIQTEVAKVKADIAPKS